MRILFIDDSPERTQIFRANALEHDIVYAATFQEAKQALSGVPFDLIYLDHDLAEVHYQQDSRTGTGTELAEIIAAHSRKHQKTVVILHSLNHAGRQRMQSILSAARIQNVDAPWAWMRPIPNV